MRKFVQFLLCISFYSGAFAQNAETPVESGDTGKPIDTTAEEETKLIVVPLTKLNVQYQKNYSFVPDSLTKKLTKKFTMESTDVTPDYVMQLDFSNEPYSSTLLKKEDKAYKPIAQKKFKVRHKSWLGIVAINPTMAYDSLNFSYEFTNAHIESKSQFEGYINSLVPQNGIAGGGVPEDVQQENMVDTKAKTDSLSTANKKTSDDNEVVLKRLLKQLSEYNTFVQQSFLSKSEWRINLALIDRQIFEAFDIFYSDANGLKTGLERYSQNSALIAQIVETYAAVRTYDVKSYMPILIEDFDNLEIKFDAKFNDKKTSRSYTLPVKGGFKIDFSIGLGYSSLQNKHYQYINAGSRSDTTVTVDGTDTTTSIEDVELKKVGLKSTDRKLFVATMAHGYFRSGGNFNWGPTIGFLVNTDGKFDYIAGLSAILGRKQRFILSTGVTLGKVEVLNPKFEEGKIYEESFFDGKTEADLTENIWDVGWFATLTWNFGSVNKNE